VGLTEGGWDRPHNRARTLGECDGNNEGNKDDDKEYERTATSPRIETNTLVPPNDKKLQNSQPKTCGLDGGETRYEAQPAGGAVGAQVDCFLAIDLGQCKKVK
jgi:hypothetical protein